MKTVGIIQPNYIPWRGYFDFICDVDVFVFLDDVQYTVQDWRNRNKIKRPNGPAMWLSVPVIGGINQLIKDVRIDRSQAWADKHLKTVRQNYGKAPFFAEYFEGFADILHRDYEYLADLDIDLTKWIAGLLNIDTKFARAKDIPGAGVKNERLLKIVQHFEGQEYLSGPAAKAYMRDEFWEDAGIAVSYKNYDGYPEYSQIREPFEPAVSVMDLLFMTGPAAPNYFSAEYRACHGS